ncbi:EpsG family protein [Lysobacter sp. LF1]|uniref:EpsG family protein n=1 Tax=Lysobacter stagni TaxID=3045172 RepID=A0ABT6XJE8_9GAMM|nr:EpsG family protein [Lysobacter sp. LF1]MDI9240257.1 EpsG family protein [Lysobacter sp. LF1]
MNASVDMLSAPQPRRQADAPAAAALSALLLIAVALFGLWLVGMRSPDIGTDTHTYAGFFENQNEQGVETRLEPGFVYLTYLLWKLDVGVIGYQIVLFALLLGSIVVSTRRYFDYLGDTRGYLTFLGAALMLLYVSPMFVNASINAVRQGLAALLVFTSLLSFKERRWWSFVIYGAIASSLHLSSLLYLVFAPVLLFGTRMQRVIAATAFVMYVTGLSMALVRALIPGLYEVVMSYTANSYYRSGVRADFALFSIFWYMVPHALAPLVRAEYRQKIKDSTAVYLAMMLPFFGIGWGYFSNRYLLPAWLSVSLILAAMLVHSRIPLVRHPLLLRFGLLLSCAAFYYYVTHEIVI